VHTETVKLLLKDDETIAPRHVRPAELAKAAYDSTLTLGHYAPYIFTFGRAHVLCSSTGVGDIRQFSSDRLES
jgi:hypothetical protein